MADDADNLARLAVKQQPLPKRVFAGEHLARQGVVDDDDRGGFGTVEPVNSRPLLSAIRIGAEVIGVAMRKSAAVLLRLEDAAALLITGMS